MTTIVGPKGQVVIEKEIRERLGIKRGAIAVQTIVGARVEIRFVPPAHARSLFGILAPYARATAQNEDWAKTKRRAWESAVHEETDRPYAAESGTPKPKGRRRGQRRRK